jgi:purine-nucleoside phosphorylase
MMTVHIGANRGDVAEAVLLPGDPLRARYIAETFLDHVECYNEVRGMLGYTGTYQGKRVSVQGTGMGMPSASIYVHELIHEFGVKQLVRVGTCGAIQADVKVRDVVLAQGACTDSSMNRNVFGGIDYAPIASFELLEKAYRIGKQRADLELRVGNVYSSDQFYNEDATIMDKLGRYGILAVEMETAALYTLAARFGVQGLAIMTVSDHVLTGEQTTSLERQTTFNQMIEVALDTVI